MEPTEPGSAANVPAPTTPRFKWWDAVVVFLAGTLLGASVGYALGFAISGDKVGDIGPVTIGFAFAGQYLTYGFVTWLYCRHRGTGSLRRDLGWTVRVSDAWAIALGTACAIGFGILILPLRHFIHESQSIVDDLNDSSGAKLAVIAVGALVLAPLFEELLFRGLLLRSLRPLMSDGWAIGVQATVFGAVHFVGGSPLGTLIALPALIGLGVVSGILAVRSGSLSQSILLHVGFNLLAVVAALSG